MCELKNICNLKNFLNHIKPKSSGSSLLKLFPPDPLPCPPPAELPSPGNLKLPPNPLLCCKV
ncbi:hypothetical protein BpHYR1_024708 [Brachionus plicatilis]|uniref:Uncharacterized protein n=1 Tax=Brachionus plicatilis TaxID=10195 RepID=A0A3M7SBZ7_BRAPC|nr:hypothetical protein BpHYR1_024708 [Brachionus plicatilis]